MFVSKTSSGLTKLIHQNLSRIPERKSPPKNNILTSSKPELRRRYPVYFHYFSPKWTGLRVLKATGLRNRVHLRRLRGCSRDGAVFSGESLFEGQKSPCMGTNSYRTSSRNFRISPADLPEKYFWVSEDEIVMI